MATNTDDVRRSLLAGADQLAKQARTAARLRAAFLWGAIAVGSVATLVLFDSLIRREEVGLRFLFLACFLAIIVIAARLVVLPAWKFSPTRLDLALWIESHRPELGNRLSTALQIAESKPDEARYGSRGFRESVLKNWASETPKPIWQEFLNARPILRAAGCLLLISIAAFIGFTAWPQESQLGLKRLLNPLGAYRWPQQDQLLIQNLPSLVTTGSSPQLEIIDQSPPLPDDVSLLFRIEGSDQTSQIPAAMVADLAVVNLPSIASSIEVRAVGGDDQSMPWSTIKVITPPRLVTMQFNIAPPAYTGKPTGSLIGNKIQVLAGSDIQFEGVFNESIQSVRLKSNGSNPSNLPDVRLASDRRSISFQIKNMGRAPASENNESTDRSAEAIAATRTLSWQFEIKTEAGLLVTSPDNWSIEAIEDQIPIVLLKSPEIYQITPNAKIPLLGSATDDLGLVDAKAVLTIEGVNQTYVANVPVWSVDLNDDLYGTTPEERIVSNTTEIELNNEADLGRLDLSTFDGSAKNGEVAATLAAGQIVSVSLEATDSFGQVGKSEPQRFNVRTPAEVLYEVQQRQNQLLSEMRELVQAQSRNEQMTSKTAERIKARESVEQPDVDTLAGVEQMQLAIQQRLVSSNNNSIATRIEQLQNFLDRNALSDSVANQTLESLQTQIASESTAALNDATNASRTTQRELAESIKRGGKEVDDSLEELRESTNAQTAARKSLEALADQLDRSDALQKAQREFSQIAQAQEALRRETNDLKLDNLTATNPDDLDRRKAEILAEQRGLSSKLNDAVASALDRAKTASLDSDAIQQQLQNAATSLLEGQASSVMRRAAEAIASNDFDDAEQLQNDANEALNTALEQLGMAGPNDSAGSLQEFADNLRSTSQELSKLASEQAALASELSSPSSASTADQLADQQSDLSRKTTEQSKQARAAGDTRTANASERAAAKQQEAERQTRDNDLNAAAESAEDAAQALADAADQAAERARDLDQQIQEQQLDNLSVALAELVAEQEPIVVLLDDMAEQMRDAQTPEQKALAKQLARDQETVRQLLKSVQEKSSRLPAFDWTLEQAEQDMSRAVAAAQRFRIAPDAQQAANAAYKRLTLAAMAAKTSPVDEQANAPEDTPDESPSPQDDGEQRALPPLASLRLLRALQEQLNLETKQFNSQPPSASNRQRLSELALEQELLGKQLEQLLRELSNDSQTSENIRE